MAIENILALESSTFAAHLALKTPTGLEVRMIDGGFQHSEQLLSETRELLARRKLEIRDLDLLVCSRGPGSFTSLRIAMATLKGFSTALGIPLVSVPTLETMASAWSFPGEATLAVIDARKRRWYLGLYKDGVRIGDDIDGVAANIAPRLEGLERVFLTGPDAKAFAPSLKEACPDVEIITDPCAPRPLGQVLIDLGTEQFLKVGADDIGQGPAYIRRSDAEEALLARQGEVNDLQHEAAGMRRRLRMPDVD